MRKTTFRIDSYLTPAEAFHFARKNLATQYPAKAHDHDYFEIFLIERGRTAHWINGVTQTLGMGHLAFVRPGDVHAFCADEATGCQISNIMFRLETARHFIDRYGTSTDGRFLDARGPLPDMVRLTADRFDHAVGIARQLQASERSLARIDEFLLVLVNHLADATGSEFAAWPQWFAEACSAAQSRDVFRHGTSGFLRAAGRSREHVCRTCKALTGLTPSEYVNRIRLDYAARLLRNDEASIETIAVECGFENLSYFYRLFRRRFAESPRGYRLSHRRSPFQLET